MFSGGFFKQLRILFLLFVLFIVGVDTYLTRIRSTDWDLPLRVVIYPINGDGSETVTQYISQLNVEPFREIETFMQEEAAQFQLPLKEPLTIKLAHQVVSHPPKPPQDRNMLNVMWWSLQLRYWAYSVDEYQGPAPNVRIFVVYFTAEDNKHLDHSLGLQKGMIGVVNAFADKQMEAQNNIVIAHEFLHTLGATDKYDLNSNQPLFPDGFFEPDKEPLYPQEYAEIMAGAIPVSKTQSEMPKGLYQTIIGKQSAREINWVH